MKVAFLYANKPRERVLADAFIDGVKAGGDEGEAHLNTIFRHRETDAETVCLPSPTEVDAACMVGVKSMKLWRQARASDLHICYLDKGYLRHRGKNTRCWEYWRVSVDAHHPTDYLMRAKHDSARWDKHNIDVKPWRERGDHVLFLGSSEKYHAFYGLPHPTEYAQRIVKRIAKMTGRPIVYRPKPSWHAAEPVRKAKFSPPSESISDALRNAHCVVTHGSNGCFEALMHGIPCIVLGEAVAKPVSSTSLDDIESPRLASDEDRNQLFWNLAYCQWTLSEMASGEAWSVIKPQFYG